MVDIFILVGIAWVFQVRVSFVKDVQKQEAWWERQHELTAENFVVKISSNISYSPSSSFNFYFFKF